MFPCVSFDYFSERNVFHITIQLPIIVYRLVKFYLRHARFIKLYKFHLTEKTLSQQNKCKCIWIDHWNCNCHCIYFILCTANMHMSQNVLNQRNNPKNADWFCEMSHHKVLHVYFATVLFSKKGSRCRFHWNCIRSYFIILWRFRLRLVLCSTFIYLIPRTMAVSHTHTHTPKPILFSS